MNSTCVYDYDRRQENIVESSTLACVDQVTMNLDRDTSQWSWCWHLMSSAGGHHDIKSVHLEILSLSCKMKVWIVLLLFVLMFCNVSGNDVWALHYIKQLGWARDGGGAFPPSSQPSSGQSGAGLRDSDQWKAGTGSGGRSRSWVRPAQLECGQRTLYSLSSQSVVVCLLRDD